MIVTLTMNSSVDLYGVTERLIDGGKSRCDAREVTPGGGGINVARGLRSLGSEVLAVFPSGGSNGVKLERLLEGGISYRSIPISGEIRENVAVREKDTARLYHIVFPGPRLSESEWGDCLEKISAIRPAPAYLVLSGSLPAGVPADFYARAIRAAAGNGTRVVLDTSGPALGAALEEGVYLVKLNRREFDRFGAPESAGREDSLRAMDGMVRDGCAEVVIVTLDKGGALLAGKGESLRAMPPPIEPVSQVGAGDSFTAALVHQLHQGHQLREAFRHGVAAAGAAVQTPGNRLFDTRELETIARRVQFL